LKINRFVLVVLIAFTLLSPSAGHGQRMAVLNMMRYDDDMFHFGFVLGINQSLVSIRPIANLTSYTWDSTFIPDILPLPDSARILTLTSRPTPGFVISIVSDLRLGEHFNLRFIPSLSFGDRDILYTIMTFRKGDTLLVDVTKKVPSTYINFPLEVKFKAKRYNNFRPYLMAGVQFTLDLASQAKKREQKNRDQKIIKFNSSDVYIEAGVGFDFYNEWFKMGIELKMMYGLMDMVKREENLYTNSIDKLSSKIFQLSFTFE